MSTKHSYEDVEADQKTGVAEIATASIDTITAEARKAFEDEHALSFSKAVWLYPPAVGWSLFFSLGIVMYEDTPAPMLSLTIVGPPSILNF